MLKGTADANFSVPLFGDKAISDFAFKNAIDLPGWNGLPDISFNNSKSDGRAGSNMYYAFINFDIKSPSNLKLILGDIGFKIKDATGLASGTMVLNSMTLEQGDNIVTAVAYTNSPYEGTAGFMKAIDVGDVTVTMDGIGSVVTKFTTALNPAINALHTKFVFPKKFGSLDASLDIFILFERISKQDLAVYFHMNRNWSFFLFSKRARAGLLGRRVLYYPDCGEERSKQGVGFGTVYILKGLNGVPVAKFVSLIDKTVMPPSRSKLSRSRSTSSNRQPSASN